jgi:putative CocE/NonD family hydrolase
MRLVAFLLLSAFSAAGQPNFAGGGASSPGGRPIVTPIKILSHQPVAMRDGVKLYADVYLPAAPGKYPVLVVRTPYGVQRDGVHEEMIPFAQNGFAVVVQDCRGRYESEGQWDPFRSEGRDGYDTIEWAAKQPWSNGKVATQGGSYLGHVQWAAMSLQPPSLVAAIPRVASTSIYHNWAYFGGAFRLSFNYGWGVVRMPFRIMQPQYWHASAVAPEELRYENILWQLPLKTHDLASSNTIVQHYRDWVEHSSYDDYWKQISDEEHFDKIKVPLYTQGGWYDIFLAGTINGYTGVRAKGSAEAKRSVKMWIGPWGHGPSQKFGEVDFGPTANLTHPPRELRWYNHYLKGEPNGVDREPAVDIFYMGVNKWKGHPDWPIPGTKFTSYYLSSGGSANSLRGDGGLTAAKPSGAPSDSYHYDPLNPVMTLGGNNCCGTPTLAGPHDQRPVERRGDVLVYSSEILKDPLAIAGPVKMKLWAATDGPDTDWMVKLVDVYPNGYAMNIAEGILRARFRQGLDKPELLQPNQAYEFEVDMVGTANVFQPGHRIRVDITSSNFPQFDRNLNTGDKPGEGTKPRVARNTVFHTGDRPSAIILPVVALP